MLGIVVGMVAVSSVSGPVQLVVSGILVSIALGSFFYVALVEILPNELNKNSSLKLLMLKLVLVFAGWSIMALIAKWA
jgi:zinc transporter ZupT